MAADMIRVYSDEQGVWWDFGNGHRCCHEWNAIVGLAASKMDAATPPITILELIFEWGHADLNDSILGFAEVVAKMSRHLPSLATDWFQTIERMAPEDPTITVWHRDPPTTN